MNANHLLK